MCPGVAQHKMRVQFIDCASTLCIESAVLAASTEGPNVEAKACPFRMRVFDALNP
jgi:hypothetical protein